MNAKVLKLFELLTPFQILVYETQFPPILIVTGLGQISGSTLTVIVATSCSCEMRQKMP